mmetsp:Transcript_5316/g.14514  ORF Transcript_5316/g.14514 Transcript_5316/m.14514 type:complete len:223 (-) Transcript_5316:110-778(-)
MTAPRYFSRWLTRPPTTTCSMPPKAWSGRSATSKSRILVLSVCRHSPSRVRTKHEWLPPAAVPVCTTTARRSYSMPMPGRDGSESVAPDAADAEPGPAPSPAPPPPPPPPPDAPASALAAAAGGSSAVSSPVTPRSSSSASSSGPSSASLPSAPTSTNGAKSSIKGNSHRSLTLTRAIVSKSNSKRRGAMSSTAGAAARLQRFIVTRDSAPASPPSPSPLPV